MSGRGEAGLAAPIRTTAGAERDGVLLGLLGVLGFSFSLPATRLADPAFGGVVVGLGRALVAGALAATLLALRRERPPARRHWPGLAVVVLGVIVGFPLLSALALQDVPVAHAAVVAGLLPAMTAVVATLRAGERPSRGFWLACGLGVVAVLLFAWSSGGGRPRPQDLLLLLAVICGGAGYAEGGRLAQTLGGPRVICWALVAAAPLLLVPVLIAAARYPIRPTPGAWFGLAYVSLISMFFAFFAWYAGLARGGIARVGQVQLIQPVLTLCWAALWLDERIGVATVAAAIAVIVSAAVTRRMSVARAAVATNPETLV